MLRLRPYAKSLHKVPLYSTPMWMPGERWPRTKGATREGREGLCLLMECCPGPGRFGSFFHCFLSWLREVCRCHILKSDPQNQLHPAVLLLRTCGLKFYDQISLSFKCLHWTGSKTLHGWVCSLMCHSGSHGWLFLWPHQPSVGVPWNSKVPWTEKRLE